MLHNWFSESFSKNSFFLQDFFLFQNTFLSNKTTNYDRFTSRFFFSDQWAYISCVTIFYYLYCMVQEVYILVAPMINMLHQQYCCLNGQYWQIFLYLRKKGTRNWSYSDPNALPISWSAEYFPSIGISYRILKVFVILFSNKNYVKSTFFYDSKEILLCTLISISLKYFEVYTCVIYFSEFLQHKFRETTAFKLISRNYFKYKYVIR